MHERLRVAALEGPCCAGKTTQGHGLLSSFGPTAVAHVMDYSDFAGGGRNLPPAVPASVDEERKCLSRFLQLEAERTAHCRDARQVLIDRSVHTLLAHCHALEHMTGAPYTSAAQTMLEHSNAPMWPQLIYYLDIPQQEILNRNHGKFPDGIIFINGSFNKGIRNYFRKLSVRRPGLVVMVDAVRPVKELWSLIRDDLVQRGWTAKDGTC